MFAPVAKWVRRIDRADRLDDYVDMAFTAATSGRPGPVVLLVPADLLTDAAAPRSSLLRPRAMSLRQSAARPHAGRPGGDRRGGRCAGRGRHPLVVAGGGIHLSGAAAEALPPLQQEAHLPVGTTVMGKGGVDETHPLTLGVIGYVMGQGSRTGEMRPIVDRADVVLLVGNRTNQNGTDSWKLFSPNTRFIHLDADPMEVGRNTRRCVWSATPS